MSWSGLSDSQDGARAKKQRLYSPDDDRDNDSFTTSFRLNWGWVATLNQDPEGKDYFPPCFNPLGMGYHFLGDEIEKPTVLGTGELPRYTAWALAAFRRGTRSATMAKMMDDQNLRAKWVICPSKDFNGKFRDLNLSPVTAPRVHHEAAYAAMTGIVLPPERACTMCKSNRGMFQQCIVLPGYLDGSCAGCHYNSDGNGCSHQIGVSHGVTSTSISDQPRGDSAVTIDDETLLEQAKFIVGDDAYNQLMTLMSVPELSGEMKMMLDRLKTAWNGVLKNLNKKLTT
ncbi:hypothetical protein F4821DRAFT_18579 [Hypoxylon rubiginosum]|uniref:Uncharacterized protein n=1 Tax=Hypoxylon rubiginosum TaxID=110542 RepID=A0ACC0CMS2_9PEZI|nr:hypothetical protein F4821DRAFT_18579 [Hypoxylon rubiginosum]